MQHIVIRGISRLVFLQGAPFYSTLQAPLGLRGATPHRPHVPLHRSFR